MARAVLLAAALVLAVTGAADAVSYKRGLYAAGSSREDGVQLRIKRGKFSVSRISFMEHCTRSTDSFSDRFTFVSGSDAQLKGTINRRGRLRGSYEGPGGVVTVTGRVKGRRATVNASESGTYDKNDGGEPYACAGTHSFNASWVPDPATGGS